MNTFPAVEHGRWLFWAPFAGVLAVLAWSWAGPSTRPGQDLDPKQEQAARQEAAAASPLSLIVDFRDDVDDATLAANGVIEEPLSRYSSVDRAYRVRFASPAARDRAMQTLQRDPSVQSVDYDTFIQLPPDEDMRAFAGKSLEYCAKRTSEDDAGEASRGFPNDPCFAHQWHLNQIGLPTAWKAGQGDGAVVAVIDTGVTRVDDLESVPFVKGYNFVADSDNAVDDHGHGTHVAGTIAQATNNRLGVSGVAFKATIMPLKVLDGSGRGSMGAIAQAIRYAADNGAHVINMSLGGPFPVDTISTAIKYARGKGVTVIAAAGNDGKGRVGYPARYPEAVAVAATQFDEQTTFYSNWGKQVDIAAPGGNVRVDQNGDGVPDGVLQNTVVPGRPSERGYLLFMGTSMASPHVAGVAALVVGAGINNPGAVEKILTSTARRPKAKGQIEDATAEAKASRYDDHYGAGIVDAGQALKAARTKREGGGLALAATLALGLLGGRGRKGSSGGFTPALRGRFSGRAAWTAGIVLGSSGLFILSLLGVSLPGPLSVGAPLAIASLFSPDAFANPLLLSAGLPFLLIGIAFGVRKLRPVLSGFAFGVAGLLLSLAVLNLVDVSFVPDSLDRLWLLVNAGICAALGTLVSRE